MNALLRYIEENELNPTEVMNQIQGETNLLSDLCVTADEASDESAVKAVVWLKQNKEGN